VPFQRDNSPLRTPTRAPSYKLYLLLLLAPSLLLHGAMVLLIRSDFFLAYCANPFLRCLDYSYALRHVDCEVVIYGDSSAKTGINPLIVENTTGLRTCNLAQTAATLRILRTAPYDEYLAHNRPPKYVVVAFNNRTLGRHNGAYDEWFQANSQEVIVQVVRHHLTPQRALDLASHPFLTITHLSVFGLLRLPGDTSAPESTVQVMMTNFYATHGLLTLPHKPLAECPAPSQFVPATRPDAAWLADMLRRLTPPGGKILAFVTPVAICDHSWEPFKGDYRALFGRDVERYDIGLFNDANHYTAEGAARFSQTVGSEVAADLRKSRT